MIGTIYSAYFVSSGITICAKKKAVNNTLYEFNVYREVSIGPQTFKYYFYKGITERAGYYFSALPYNKAIKLITEDMEILKEKYGR